MEMFPNSYKDNPYTVKTFTFDNDKIIIRKAKHCEYKHYVIVIIEINYKTVQKCLEFENSKKQDEWFYSVDRNYAFDLYSFYIKTKLSLN